MPYLRVGANPSYDTQWGCSIEAQCTELLNSETSVRLRPPSTYDECRITDITPSCDGGRCRFKSCHHQPANAEIAQLVERSPEEPRVPGSIPGLCANVGLV